MNPLRKKSIEKEGFTIRHQYLKDSFKTKKRKKYLATRTQRKSRTAECYGKQGKGVSRQESQMLQKSSTRMKSVQRI